MKPVIFISGPMSGYSDMNTMAFQEAARELESRGWVVISPHNLPPSLTRERAMFVCISMLDHADAVYFLQGWDDSRGAQAEYYYAVARDIRQYFYPKYPNAEDWHGKI